MVDERTLDRPAARPRSRLLFLALAVALGAAAGGLYAHFIGCRTGTCPLTSSVRNASLYGAFVGAVVGWPGRRGAGRPAPLPGDRGGR